MRILIVNTLYPPAILGGAELSVSLLAKGLARTGHDVSVCTLNPQGTTTTDVEDGVTVHRLPLDNFYWPFDRDAHRGPLAKIAWHLRDTWNKAAAVRFGDILDAERPDVIHTNNITGFSASVWAEARNRGIEIVHTLRDYSLICSRSTLFRNNTACETRCLGCVCLNFSNSYNHRMINQVVSNSYYVLATHRRAGLFVDTPSSVIFNIAPVKRDERQKNLSSLSELTFGFIGRVEPEKGIEVVLRAFTDLGPGPWRLNIAGSGRSDYVDMLKRRYPATSIVWMGFTESATFFSIVDVVLISSIWPEPLPRTLIESIAFGRPAICSTAGGIPELAASCALIGSYEPNDATALGVLLRRAISDARTWKESFPPSTDSLEVFTEDHVVRRYTEIYARCAQVRAP